MQLANEAARRTIAEMFERLIECHVRQTKYLRGKRAAQRRGARNETCLQMQS